ncbi:MAG TPA: hypothetical protein VK766_10860 [Cytophagaceae bacterium]|jgi:hypothetical protein|nr:hypothetical protein [Cytophagaceae bacterium]
MKYFLYLITIGFLLGSCESKKEKPVETSDAPKDSAGVETAINKDSCAGGIYIKYAHAYNNFIVAHQSFILEENIQFIKSIKADETKEKVTELYKILEAQTQNSIDSLTKVCPFNGNVEYKNAGIELFKFYKEVWNDYKSLLEGKTKEDRAKILDKIMSRFNDAHSVQEKKLEESFNKAHSNFVNEYTLHVRSTPLHDQLDSLSYWSK